MKVHWSNAARSDLRFVQHTVTCRSNETAANALIDRIIARTERLATFPEMGRLIPDFPGVRELIVRPYLVRYHIVDGDVEIISVIHGARAM